MSTRAHDDPEAAARLAAALRWFWYFHGHYHEGRQWLERAQHAMAPASFKAKALNTAGMMAWRQGDFGRAETLIREALASAQKVGDKSEIALALHSSAHIEEKRRNHVATTKLFEESVALYREAKDEWGLCLTLDCFASAKRMLGDFAGAIHLYEESLALDQRRGDRHMKGVALSGLGVLARLQGDYDRAAELYREALPLFQEFGNLQLIAGALLSIGILAAAQARVERAVRLYGTAERLREVVGLQISLPAARADYDRNVESARENLGEKAFEAAWAEGRAMTVEQAIDCALKEDAAET